MLQTQAMLTRKTITTLAVCGAVLGAVVAGGCKKDEKKSAKAGAAAPASSDLRRALAMMPPDVEGVVGIDFGSLRASKLAAGYQARAMESIGGDFAAFQAACGFDPVQKIASIVAGGKGQRGGEDVVAVVRGLPKAELMACADKVSKDPKLAPGLTVAVDGPYVLLTAEDRSFGLQFTDDTTLVAARKAGAGATKADLAAITGAADGQGLTGNQHFMQLVDDVDTDASVWFVISGKSERVKSMGRGMLSFEAALGEVHVADGLELKAGARLENDNAAKGMADSFNKTLDSMKKSLLKNIATDVTVKADGPFVRLHAKMTKQQLEELGAFASSFIGNPFE